MGQTLLLTATITPPANAVKLARTNPADRLRDYVQSLDYYLNVPKDVIDRVVFVENSATDLAPLHAVAAKYPDKRVEFVSFYGLDYPSEYGRAYGEFKLMDHAWNQPIGILAELKPEEVVWKATGRLRLLNIRAMVRRAPRKFDFYCDLRNRPALWMEMRFYAFTPGGYRDILMNIGENIREDLHNTRAAETLIFPLIFKHVASGRVVPRFRTQPFIGGFSGYENKDYARGFKNNYKTYTRMVIRKLAPHLWV